MLSWEDVIGCIRDNTHKILKEQKPQQELWEFCFLVAGMCAASGQCLYIVKVSDFSEIHMRDGISMILLEDISVSRKQIPDGVSNCASIENEDDFAKVLSQITERMSLQYRVGYLMALLQEAVKEDQGIQSIVDIIADFMKMPVSVMDNTFCFVAKSTRYMENATNPQMRAGQESEALTEKILTTLKESGRLQEIIDAKQVAHIRLGMDSAYFAPILINHIKAGYITVYEAPGQYQSVLQKEHVHALPLIATCVSFELAKNNFYIYNKASYFTYIFSLILEKENVDIQDIRMRLKVYDYNLREYIYLLYIEIPPGNTSGMKRAAIADSLRGMFRNSIYLNRDKEMLFLISRDKYDLLGSEEMEAWNAYLSSVHLRAGLTGPFFDFADIKSRLREVKLVLNAGKRRSPERWLFCFEDYQVDAMLEQIYGGGELETFCYKPLLALIRYDEDHHTELVRTLREYLRQPKDIAGLCSELCVHRNTFYKRMDKIREIMQCDITGAEDVMKIQLTFHILEMNH